MSKTYTLTSKRDLIDKAEEVLRIRAKEDGHTIGEVKREVVEDIDNNGRIYRFSVVAE